MHDANGSKGNHPRSRALAGAMAGIALACLSAPAAQAQNLGSPPFVNPREVRYRAGEKKLRVIMEMISGSYSIPNVGTEHLRQFHGWDPAQEAIAPSKQIGPGPTLRARIGDLVEITYLNKIDDRQFSYTFDTTTSRPGLSPFGCDKSGSLYPGSDTFPNCFHGSSTANIHFHGTHASPDGVADNVLVEVLPQSKQPDWNKMLEPMFQSGKIPQHWTDLPADYRNLQVELIQQHDREAAAQARKNGLPAPESLWAKDEQLINAGQWPDYLIGAFPNFFQIPEYNVPAPEGVLRLKAGEAPPPRYRAGQAPGTHWYHAHKHGSTSLHILNGLAGAFVIESNAEGGYDHFIRKFYGWGDAYGDHEKILVFQQFDPTQNLERPNANGKGIRQVLVNGKLTPTLKMNPGEIQLWRLVNATEGNNPGVLQNTLFQTAGFQLRQTAQDGVQLSPANYAGQPILKGKDGLTLQGGNRADLLVQAPAKAGVVAFKSNKTTLFFVEVTGPAATQDPPFPPTWPDLPEFLKDQAPPAANDTTTIRFQWEAGRTGPGKTAAGPPHFMIDDKQFGQKGAVIDQCMPLNGRQDWVIENHTSIVHPFHIHINPFQVIRIETPTDTGTYGPPYAPKESYVWHDVIALPPAVIKGGVITPSRVTLRHTFLDFTGTYVLHCHILAHEDRGMMQLVRVVPAEKYPAACQGSVPSHH